MLEHLLFFVNRLKSFFPVDGCQRIHTLGSDFVFWFELLSFVFLRREINDCFSSLKLLFTSSGWTSMLKQGSNSKFGNISPSSSSVPQYEIIYLIHFPWKQHCKHSEAAYLKNRFNRVSNCAITKDICSRLLGLLHAFVYQSYNNCI